MRTIINLPYLNRRARLIRMATTSSKVFIFDTTLRDGEQAPGCSMTTTEKVRMAGKLAELGVDIMEAGFPIASTGDFEAVQAVCRSLPVKVAALARCTALDIEREREVNSAIRQLDLTRVIVAHRPETIASASRVIVLHEGRIAQDLRSVPGGGSTHAR